MKSMQTRDQFLNEVESLLKGVGFIRQDNNFTLKIQRKHPGRRMVVNGAMYEEPEVVINMELCVRDIGPGWCKTGDEVEEFEQFSFDIIINGCETVPQGESCIYYDDIENFKSEIFNLFNIRL